MPDYKICVTSKAPAKDAPAITNERLVRAKNEARAVAHVVKDTLTCDKATTDEIVRLTMAGVVIENAE